MRQDNGCRRQREVLTAADRREALLRVILTASDRVRVPWAASRSVVWVELGHCREPVFTSILWDGNVPLMVTALVAPSSLSAHAKPATVGGRVAPRSSTLVRAWHRWCSSR